MDARTHDRRQRMKHVLGAGAAAELQPGPVAPEPVVPALELPPPRPLPDLAPPSWESSANAMAKEPSWQEKLSEARSGLQDKLARTEDQLGLVEQRRERARTQLEQAQQARERMNTVASAPHPTARMQARASQQRASEISGGLEHQTEMLEAAAGKVTSSRDQLQAQLGRLPGPDELGAHIAANPQIRRAFEDRAAPRFEREIADIRAQHAAQDASLREEARQAHQQLRAELGTQRQEMQQRAEAKAAAVKDEHRARGEQATGAHEAEMAALRQQTTDRVDDHRQTSAVRATTTIAQGRSEADAVQQTGELRAAAIIAQAQAQAQARARAQAAASRARRSAAESSVQMKPTIQFQDDSGQTDSSGDDADTALQQAFATAEDLRAAIREQVERILTASGEDAATTIRDAQQLIDGWLANTANQTLLSNAHMDTFIFNDLVDEQNNAVVVILDANQMAVDNFANYQLAIDPAVNPQNPYLSDPLRHTSESISNYNANTNNFNYDLTYDYTLDSNSQQMGLVFDFQSTTDGVAQPRVISSTVLPYNEIITMNDSGTLASADRTVSSNVLLHNELGMGRPFTDHNWLFSAAGIDFTTQHRTEDANTVGGFTGCNDPAASSSGNPYSSCIANGSYDFNTHIVSLDSQRQNNHYDDAVLENSVARYAVVDQLVGNNLIPDPTLSLYNQDLYTQQWSGQLAGNTTPYGATTYATVSLAEATQTLPTAGQTVSPQADAIYDVTPAGDTGNLVISADGSNGIRGSAERVVTPTSTTDGQGNLVFAGPYPDQGTTSRPSRMIPFVPNANNDATTLNNLAGGSQGYLTSE